MRRLMRFKARGINEFKERLERSKFDPSVDFADLIDDSSAVEVLRPDKVVPNAPLTTRRHAAEAISEVLRAAGVAHSDAIHDIGLWTWMSAHWVDSLAPKTESGLRKPGAPHRWVPATTAWNTYHRHLLLGPYSIYQRYSANPDQAMCLLGSAASSPGEIVEQIAANTHLVTNDKVVALATRLYWDESAGRFRAGSAGKNPGSVRRLVAVLNQFDRTWDFHGSNVDTMLSMLPQEFGPFVSAATATPSNAG